ncbi:hypothetical protein [Falsiroseomonas selenitidurans]|uniref:Bacteriophage-related protein n=1 Tax=Falsiroseomonas selenitidurans TaxID=2716335 RepID=A0ABX1EBU3_9PROT|nr:hypothetical protein [Falsiroseomonas selenitidurans]NKC34288.1 hypothetical protein [Falsiroseomonas selenitidurans]
MTTITVHVPITIRRHGGRKLVVAPAGATATGKVPARADPALVKALARAHRWKRLLDTGQHATLDELATAEKLDRSYLGKLLRLTLLAPDIVEAVMDGREPLGVGLPALLRELPAEWQQQRDVLHGVTATDAAPASRR